MPFTFVSELATHTVHNPYALVMPTQHIMEPVGWDDAAYGGAHPTLVQVPYARPQQLPRRVLFGLACVESFSQLLRLRLGGICYGLRPVEVANVIYEACGVVCAGVDIFTNNKGCCSVWVRSEHEAELIRAAMHHCMWMGPPALGYALRAKNALSSQFLDGEVHKLVQAQGEHFPRHLVTVEHYVVRDRS
jgi:hypothetical protein